MQYYEITTIKIIIYHNLKQFTFMKMIVQPSSQLRDLLPANYTYLNLAAYFCRISQLVEMHVGGSYILVKINVAAVVFVPANIPRRASFNFLSIHLLLTLTHQAAISGGCRSPGITVEPTEPPILLIYDVSHGLTRTLGISREILFPSIQVNNPYNSSILSLFSLTKQSKRGS